MKFSSLKSVPDPSYALPRRRRRRRRIPRLGTRTGSTLLFSATTRFCDMKQERKYSFLTSRSIAKTRCTIRSSGVLLQTGRVFLMTFMVVVKSYMEVSNETSDMDCSLLFVFHSFTFRLFHTNFSIIQEKPVLISYTYKAGLEGRIRHFLQFCTNGKPKVILLDPQRTAEGSYSYHSAL